MRHHHHIGGLYADDYIFKIFGTTDAQIFHGALGHSLGCIAIARHDAVRKRSVVDAKTQGDLTFAAQRQQRTQPLGYALLLGRVFLVSIFQFGKSTSRISKIAGIYAHFLYMLGRLEGRIWVEMYIRAQRHMASCEVQLLTYITQGGSVMGGLRCQAHQSGTGSRQT